MARKLPPGITVRKQRDGQERFDVRYRLPNGVHRKKSFKGVTAAKDFLATTQVDRARGGLVDPQRSRITIAAYAAGWIDTRGDLAATTVQLYRSLLRLHIEPKLGTTSLGNADTELIRRWRSDLLKAGVGASTVAKAYRLLRAILNTAVQDGRILTNPCQIKGGGAEVAVERPVVRPALINALAAEVPSDRSAMVLLAGFCGLRIGEILGLAVRHIDLLSGTVQVERQLQEIGPGNSQCFNAPKSEASRRTIPMPVVVADALRLHIDAIDEAGPDTLLFTGDRGGPLRRHVWHSQWKMAREKLGYPQLRFHDLRHSALTLYAATGATTAELQAHAGHSTVEAAMRYQHATKDRASALARLVDEVIDADTAAQTANVRSIGGALG